MERPEGPARLWLLGVADTSIVGAEPTWVEHMPGRPPVAMALGHVLQPITPVAVVGKPTNLSSLPGDGEILIGYGVRENALGSQRRCDLGAEHCGHSNPKNPAMPRVS